MKHLLGPACSASMFVFGLWGCGPARTLDPSATAPVRIGLIAPLSGTFARDGASWRNAVEIAVREVNAAGGVLPGRPVELLVQDGESTVEGGVAASTALVLRGVVGLIGDAASDATLAVYEDQLSFQQPSVLVSAVSTTPLLTERNASLPTSERYFFRTVPSDRYQAEALARAMFDSYGCRQVTVLYVDNAYGRPMRDVLRDRFVALGGTITPADGVPFADGRTDYNVELMHIAALSPAPECIALIAYPQAAAVIVKQWWALPSRPTVAWFGTDGIRQSAFVTEIGDRYLIEGFLGTSPVTRANGPASSRFEAAYQSAFGTAPAAFASNYYDATACLLLAIARAGVLDKAAIRDAMRELNVNGGAVVSGGNLANGIRQIRLDRDINYEGASGAIDFDEFGDVRPVYDLWQYQAFGNVFTSVQTIEVMR